MKTSLATWRHRRFIDNVPVVQYEKSTFPSLIIPKKISNFCLLNVFQFILSIFYFVRLIFFWELFLSEERFFDFT